MIKAAINRILELAHVETFSFGDRQYTSSGLVPVKEPQPAALEIHTLTGIVDYVEAQKGGDLEGEEYFLQVLSPREVNLFSEIFGAFEQRKLFLTAELPENRGYPFGQWLDLETFIIQLQAHFVPDEVTATLLQMVSNIKGEAVRTDADDGISQTITAKAGIALVTDVKIPNPVTLRPYRTFLEIEQPASSYVFRLRSGADKTPQLALFEAGGGVWKLEAIAGIKKYLQGALSDVTVIA